MNSRYVLVLRCPERKGIVAAVSSFLAEQDYTIAESGQYRDPATNTFFMRVVFSPLGTAPDLGELRTAFAGIADDFAMDWAMQDLAHRSRVLILVSRFGHCLNDLLHRWRTGLLPIDIVGVVSNHDDLRSFVEWHGLPFHHLPVAARETKAAQEAQIKALVEESGTELVVLARYMQILSDDMAAYLAGRCINIHHSFLPSFKGARPYHQAHAKGVKMIGATAHYVTADLDEGPIIAQDARHVDHAPTPEELVALGQEVECAVLARAVGWHVAHRIIGNGRKTVVFT